MMPPQAFIPESVLALIGRYVVEADVARRALDDARDELATLRGQIADQQPTDTPAT